MTIIIIATSIENINALCKLDNCPCRNYNIMVVNITSEIKPGLRSWLLAPSLSTALILDRLYQCFDPWFPQQLNGNNNNSYLINLVEVI